MRYFYLTAIVLLLTVGCNPAKLTLEIKNSEDAQKTIQKALITAKPGTTIVLAAGTYKLDKRLSLDIAGITIKGQGADKTILSFKGQKSGAEGLMVTKGNFVIEDLAIEDTKGDALKVKGADQVTIRKVRVEWTDGPKTENGGYGIYPVQCKNVLVENCIAIGASDSGIYIGQSQNIIVRHNHAKQNVAGIEIENSKHADVYENTVENNTGGILVFDLPNLPMKGGQQIRVYKNKVIANNHVNFAPEGTTVALVPAGTGVMVMANDYVEVFENEIKNHQTCNISVISYLMTGKKWEDPKYDPFPEKIFIHNNTIENGGNNPSGKIGGLLKTLFGDSPVPDIVWDGVASPKHQETNPPLTNFICLKDNGKATFANIHLGKLQEGKPTVTTDIQKFTGEGTKIEPVTISQEASNAAK